MPSTGRYLLPTLLVALVFLSACDSADDRAVTHHEKGLSLLEAGEVDKATLEFRNAIRLSETAVPPRMSFAKILITKNDLQSAAGLLQQVITIEPSNVEARNMLARMFILSDQTADATLHIDAALRADPTNSVARTLKASTELRAGNIENAREIIHQVLDQTPDDAPALMVLAGILVRDEKPADAIALLDRALSTSPEDFSIHLAKIRALVAIGDQNAIGTQLVTMFQLQPENSRVVTDLVNWHLTNGDKDAAEQVLRARAAYNPENLLHELAVVDFRDRVFGPEAARQRLDELLREYPGEITIEIAMANLDEREGNAQAAVERLQSMLTRDLGERENRLRSRLAQILLEQGNKEEARGHVANVLASDPSNVTALTLRGQIHIDDDDPEAAISDLRAALDGSPQDPRILMVLARAHERNGTRGLALERLALAVRASNAGATESLAYAEYLVRDQKFSQAEEVLKNAQTRNQNAVPVLAGLARIYLRQSKWVEADAVAAQLEQMKANNNAQQSAHEIRVAVLTGQKRYDESIGALMAMWNASGERTSAMENLVRNYLAKDDTDGAISVINGILADEPKNLRANLLLGAVHAFGGKEKDAETAYRRVIDHHPTREAGYGALSRLLFSLGRQDDAYQTIDDGIRAVKYAPGLMFAQAERLELSGDVAGAISIYEQLYKTNKLSDVLANNYASLLSDYRDDPVSLETAFNVAKRLRGSSNPAFQDTFGWILYKRGEYEQAVQPLGAAAQGLPRNGLVQFHFGMLMYALGREDVATETLQLAVTLFDASDMPQVATALATLENLSSQ